MTDTEIKEKYCLDNTANFKKAVIKQLIQEINELTLCECPIVTEYEITVFLNDYIDDYTEQKLKLKQRYGDNHMQDVLFWIVDYFKNIYFEDILKYVHYNKKTCNSESKILKD